MTSQNLVNIGSDNGLLPDDIKPLLKPISQEMLQIFILEMSLKITDSRTQPNLLGDSELKQKRRNSRGPFY